MYHWVQHFAPELEKRMRRHLRPCRGPWYVDETYIRVSWQWRYLDHGKDSDEILTHRPAWLTGEGLSPNRVCTKSC
jgi:transposase-like protein